MEGTPDAHVLGLVEVLPFLVDEDLGVCQVLAAGRAGSGLQMQVGADVRKVGLGGIAQTKDQKRPSRIGRSDRMTLEAFFHGDRLDLDHETS